MELTDYQLIQKCLEGKYEYFEDLVNRYKKLIYSVVFNMIKDREETNDISQEVFLKIYKNLSRYNPEYKFSTWSVRIATNLCLDMLRKKRLNSLPIEEIEGMPSEKAGTPESVYINNERKELLKRAIDELPEKYKRPLILFHEKGLSYEEMTKVLDQPMTIIKNRLYRARLMLRKKLAPVRKEEVI